MSFIPESKSNGGDEGLDEPGAASDGKSRDVSPDAAMPGPAAAPGCPAWRSRAGGTAGLPDLLGGTMLLPSMASVWKAVLWGFL